MQLAWTAALAAALFAWSPLQASAQEALDEPAGAAILTIEGAIGVANVGDKAVFDRDMLEAMGSVAITTETPWYSGPVTFEGVPLASVLERVGAMGSAVLAVALNDYQTEIPLSDFQEYGTILALKRDGEYMPVSDMGPLFIVYPYDDVAELHSQKFYGRSVWQLSRLIVR
jgi:hypothetical protein